MGDARNMKLGRKGKGKGQGTEGGKIFLCGPKCRHYSVLACIKKTAGSMGKVLGRGIRKYKAPF